MYKVPQQPERILAGVSGIIDNLKSTTRTTFMNMLKEDALHTATNPAKQFAIAAVVIDPADASKFLAVKRPPHAKSLPDVWGLPAIIVKYGEEPEIAVARLAREKLNTQVEFLGCLDIDSIDRGDYELTLMDVVVRLVGKEPSVWEAPTEQTKYVQQQWTNDLSILEEAALKGSVCSRILLKSRGITYRRLS